MEIGENENIQENENKDNAPKEENNENNIKEDDNNIKEEVNNMKENENDIKEENNNIKEDNIIKNEDDNNKVDNNIVEKLEQNNIQENNDISQEKNNILNIKNENENCNKKDNIAEENINDKDDQNININQESKIKEEKPQDFQADKFSEKVLNIPIYIHSAKTIEINTVPVLIYFIRGKLVHKEILRTFNDFDIFYQALSSAWPCICIPGLAFKQSIPGSNTTIRFPDIKTKLLNHFFKKLSESKPLITCEATKIFLSQDKNFNIKLSNLNSPNIKEISEIYSKTFTDYVDNKKITDEKETTIKRFMKLLDVTYKKLTDVGKTIENEIYNIKKEQNSLDFVTTMFLDLEKSIPNPKKCLTDINDVVKPLKSVSN